MRILIVITFIISSASFQQAFGQEHTVLTQDPNREGAELIGTMAPEWSNVRWINSDTLKLIDLKGKVVLVRWWVDQCPFCAQSSTALNEFHEKYEVDGLKVIGMFHPKPRPASTSIEYVKQAADALEFTFPIAIDDHWETLNEYWLNARRNFTSVSFLIDREGVIRYIHPGPEYHEDGKGKHKQCKEDYLELDAFIQYLLD